MNDYQDGRRDEAYLRGLSQEIKALKAERDAALNMIKGQATVIDTWRRTAEQLEAERDKLRAALDAILTNTSDGGAANCARRALEAEGEK
jgi:hypothetical protein